jgi:hypothetical protein
MRRVRLGTVLCLFCLPAASQAPGSDEALLAKTRSLYDAPFTRNLALFDCAVRFDWQKHLAETLGSVPPAALPTVEHLQSVTHRVFIDRSGATVSAQPKAPDFAGDRSAVRLEPVLTAMITQGLNAWLPFSTNVILPVGPTKYNFEKLDTGYKLTMSGPGVASTILLDAELRVTSGVAQQPQDLRFTTQFIKGPDGYLLESVRTGSTSGDTSGDATFAFTYQTVEGFQLPSEVVVSPSTTEPWRFSLADCKVAKSATVHVGTLPRAPQ